MLIATAVLNKLAGKWWQAVMVVIVEVMFTE
jgi:hypothetical protein